MSTSQTFTGDLRSEAQEFKRDKGQAPTTNTIETIC
jgi:hypothetical protein